MIEIQRVGVVGCGMMGSGFADLCTRAGIDVTVVVSTESGLDRGWQRLTESWERALGKGKINPTDVDTLRTRVSLGTDLKLLRDCQFVLEAVRESLSDKLEIFRELGTVVTCPDAVLASTTSSIPIMRLGQVTENPGRVAGLHFFNPVQVMPLVELIGSLRTSTATLERARSFVADVLGKQVILGQDRPGFVVNALLVPYLLAAVRMVQSGTASAEDIDCGMRLGCGHPMGPLALIDLIGLDTIAAVSEAIYAELKEPQYSPPPLLLRMIEAGLLGKKSGEGFYAY